MSEYRFSARGRIKRILRDTLMSGAIGIILLLIGKIRFLKYIVWIPLIWIAYNYFCNILYSTVMTVKVSSAGLAVRIFRIKPPKTLWGEINKVKIYREKGKMVKITIYTAKEGNLLTLDNGIKNCEQLFKEILANVNPDVVVDKSKKTR